MLPSNGQPKTSPFANRPDGNSEEQQASNKIEILTVGQLQELNPTLHPPVIEGLIRERETLNIISVSKIGKSWLMYDLLLCIVTGRAWLGRFVTSRGRVLLIDNELHRPTLARRIKTVADALSIPCADYADAIDVWPLRGALQDIHGIRRGLEKLPAARYRLIAIDAKYRAIPEGSNENDNADETHFYNEIDRLAEVTRAAFAMVHHSSKGSQSDKRVTDVGSGAGAQSRAADCHLVLREHEQPNAVVLDAAARSFPPIEPMGLRWQFPRWMPDADLEIKQYKGKRSRAEEKQCEKDTEADDLILAELETWKSARELRKRTGMSEGRVDRAINRLRKDGLLDEQIQNRRGNTCEVYRNKSNAE